VTSFVDINLSVGYVLCFWGVGCFAYFFLVKGPFLWACILRFMRTEKFSAAKVIFTEGELGEEAYRIVSGRVEISIEEHGRKIILATLGRGEIFGEMAMLDQRPRSATARFLEPTTLEVISREEFGGMLAGGGQALLPYLSTIFDRLRTTNDRLLLALDQTSQVEASAESGREGKDGVPVRFLVRIECESLEMQQQTALHGRVVQAYPFHFGRRASLAGVESVMSNQLLIADRPPYRVSRQHCILDRNESGVFVEDQISKLGTIVNGRSIGGKNPESRVRLSVGENSLVLGGFDSQVRFKLTVS
jgi:hypothetical protein